MNGNGRDNAKCNKQCLLCCNRTQWKLNDWHEGLGKKKYPICDLDLLIMHHYSAKPKALIEYKSEVMHKDIVLRGWDIGRTDDMNVKSLTALGNGTIPVFLVRYTNEFLEWLVVPLDPNQRAGLSQGTLDKFVKRNNVKPCNGEIVLSERDFAEFLCMLHYSDSNLYETRLTELPELEREVRKEKAEWLASKVIRDKSRRPQIIKRRAIRPKPKPARRSTRPRAKRKTRS